MLPCGSVCCKSQRGGHATYFFFLGLYSVVGTLLEYSGGFGGSGGSMITTLQFKQRMGLPAASSGKLNWFWQFAQVTINTVAILKKLVPEKHSTNCGQADYGQAMGALRRSRTSHSSAMVHPLCDSRTIGGFWKGPYPIMNYSIGNPPS